MSFLTNDLPVIAQKLIKTEISIGNDNAFFVNKLYETNKYYKYPLSIFLEVYALADFFIKRYAYVELPGKARKYSTMPEFVIGKKDGYKHPLFGLLSSKTLVYSNGAVYMCWNQDYFNMILFVDKQYIDSSKIMPTPDVLLEYKITGRVNFDEPSKYHFLDRNL